MARFLKTPGINTLCTPAYLYFILSVIILIIAGLMMNTDSMKQFCVGRCSFLQVILLFVIKFLFIVFWTWILNVLCRGGASWLSWFLILFPFIMMALIYLTMFSNFLLSSSANMYGQFLPHNLPGNVISTSGNVISAIQPQIQPVVNGQPGQPTQPGQPMQPGQPSQPNQQPVQPSEHLRGAFPPAGMNPFSPGAN